MSLSRLVLELAVQSGSLAGLAEGKRRVDEMGAAGQAANRHFAQMGSSFAKGMASMATARELNQRLVEPGIRAAGDMQDALAGLEVNLDMRSVEEMQATLAKAQSDAARIAAPTVFSGTEVVRDIQTALKKAGVAEQDILGEGGAAEAAAKLATAEKLSAEQAVDAMIAMGGIFSLQGQQFTESADLLARAGGAASTNAAELKEALSQAAVVGTLGVSQEETLAVLGAMSSTKRGGAAGTSLSAFLRQAAQADQKYSEFDFYDDAGQLKPLVDVAANLREAMAGHSPQEQQLALQKAFGDEGASAALAMLKTGDGSLESVLQAMDNSRSLDDKVSVMAGTYSAQSRALGGTAESTLAVLFRPALDPLTKGAGKANDALTSLAEAAERDPRIAKGATGAAVAGVGVAGAMGLYHLARAGGSGLAGLKSILGGAAGTAAGVAQGKALEKATGVTPVFVTNWPVGTSLPGGIGGLGANGMVPKGKGGQAMALASSAFTGVAIGTAIDQQLIGQGTKAEAVVQALLAQYALSMGGALMSDQTRDEFQRTRNAGINLVVNIDKNGNVAAEVDGEQAYARSGAGA